MTTISMFVLALEKDLWIKTANWNDIERESIQSLARICSVQDRQYFDRSPLGKDAEIQRHRCLLN